MTAPRIHSFSLALTCSVLLLSAAFTLRDAHAGAQTPGDAEHPVVKITAPSAGSAATWNSLVPYSVVVSFQGKSTQYQEIPSSQVLLRATYAADLSQMAANPATPTPDGLLDIVRSNCLGCHEFKARAMGPSFAAIAGRFPDNQASIETLSRYIRDGSTGVWGSASMPPHAEFSDDQLRAMALWIVKNAADPNVTWYVGTDGAFRMQAPATPAPNAGMVLTASYTSPVPPAKSAQAAYGQNTVILHGK